MERKLCRGHKGGAAFICNITGTCPFAGESGDEKVNIGGRIQSTILRSPVIEDKQKPRGIHIKKEAVKKED